MTIGSLKSAACAYPVGERKSDKSSTYGEKVKMYHFLKLFDISLNMIIIYVIIKCNNVRIVFKAIPDFWIQQL
jgi:hypothetical protein